MRCIVSTRMPCHGPVGSHAYNDPGVWAPFEWYWGVHGQKVCSEKQSGGNHADSDWAEDATCAT